MVNFKLKDMKNKIQYIALIFLAVVIGSCEDEEKNPLPDMTRSSIPVFLQKSNDSGFINFIDFGATTLSFDVDRLGSEDVERIDVLITFNNSKTGESETAEYSTVNTFPTPVTLTFNDLIGLFEPEVLTPDTLSLGDSFVVQGNTLLTDGRYLSGGYSPSVVANHPVILTYNVACASDLGGTYDMKLISGPATASTLSNQVISVQGPGYYEIPDITMEYFAGLAVKYRFTDICGTLVPDDSSVDYGDQIVASLAGTTIDDATGVITFHVEYVGASCCGLLGKKIVFTATPK